jgi:hypothetical protein
MVEPSPHTFDEAQLQIYTLMHRDSYPRFINSHMYRRLLRNEDIKTWLPISPTRFFPEIFSLFFLLSSNGFFCLHDTFHSVDVPLSRVYADVEPKRSLIIIREYQIRCPLHHRRYWIKIFLYMYIFLQNISSLIRHNFLMRARYSIPRLSTVMNSSFLSPSCLLLCLCVCVYARFLSISLLVVSVCI